jgi:hypothetical protein
MLFKRQVLYSLMESVVNDKIAGSVPRNTAKNYRWAVNVWDQWAKARHDNLNIPRVPL